jgi:hypothetical protein
MERLIALLSTAAVEVRNLEGEATRLLYDHGDQQGYTRQLRHKAILLSGLADAVAELGPLPPEIDALVRERIGGFSFEADRALRVDSVFYMSVLLWPEDAQQGESNELEALIRLLRDQHLPQSAAPALPGNPGGQGQPPSRR